MRNTRDIVEELKHIPHKVLEKIFIEKLKNGGYNDFKNSYSLEDSSDVFKHKDLKEYELNLRKKTKDYGDSLEIENKRV